MSERELVTLAFGNYSTLVATQWVNCTSRYDVSHSTLFREVSAARVINGSGDTGGRARVPRLLMVDAPHATDMRELATVEEKLEDTGVDEDEQKPDDRVQSVLRAPAALSAEEQRAERAVRAVRTRWWERDTSTGPPSSADDEEEDREHAGSSEDDDDEDGIFNQLIHPSAGGTPPSAPSHGQQPPCAEDAKTRKKGKERATGRELFKRKDTCVPWWRYVTTHLDADSLTVLPTPHTTDSAGAVPAMHNFGYGLAAFEPGSGRHANNEAERFGDALRRQLECADALQGLQCFIDGDSMFGGAAHNALTNFWEDAGEKTPVALFASFYPLPVSMTDAAASTHIAFASRRREELALNRLLCCSALSAHKSALYVPIELAEWDAFFSPSRASPSSANWWLSDDTATAQYLAAVADTTLFGVRDGADGGGPAYNLSQWTRVLRPNDSMRVSALLGKLPLPLHASESARSHRDGANDLWGFLQRCPLLPPTESGADGGGGEGFVPLTHSVAHSPQSTAGAVVGHALSLRGAAVLSSAVYPPQEAMLRCRLSRGMDGYLPLLTRSNLPVSATFPLPLLFASEASMASTAELVAKASGGSRNLRDAVGQNGVDVGAHAVTSFASAGMIGRVLAEARAALRGPSLHHQVSYHMEKETLTEHIEDVAQIYDDYHHGDLAAADGSENDGDDDDDW